MILPRLWRFVVVMNLGRRVVNLAHSQKQRAKEVVRALVETSERYKKEDRIDMRFVEANSWNVQQVKVQDVGRRRR